MNATVTETDTELDDYVAAVGAALADLPDAARRELLEDLASHLREYDRTAGSLRDQLGAPEAYAAELRASAGYPAPHELPNARRSWVERRSAQLAGAVTAHPWWRATVDFLPELRPAWWVVRAWAVVAVLAGDASIVPSVGDNPFLGLLALAVLIPLSVRHGRRARSRRPALSPLALVAGVAAALALLGVVAWISTEQRHGSAADAVYEGDRGPPPLGGAGDEPVIAAWPVYSADGSQLVRHDYAEQLSDGTIVVSIRGEAQRAERCPDGSQRLCLRSGPATPPTGTPPFTAGPTTAAPAPAPPPTIAPPTTTPPPGGEPPATTTATG